jgi:hypothetical protein
LLFVFGGGWVWEGWGWALWWFCCVVLLLVVVGSGLGWMLILCGWLVGCLGLGRVGVWVTDSRVVGFSSLRCRAPL